MICTGRNAANSAKEAARAPATCPRIPAADPSTPSETRRSKESTSPKTTNRSLPWRIKCSSRRVRKDRPRPSTYRASSKLVLPEALAPLIRGDLESSSRFTNCKQRKYVTCTRRRDMESKHHRHHDIARRGISGRANQTTAVAVGQAQFHVLSIDRSQSIQ